jgi:predicted porin
VETKVNGGAAWRPSAAVLASIFLMSAPGHVFAQTASAGTGPSGDAPAQAAQDAPLAAPDAAKTPPPEQLAQANPAPSSPAPSKPAVAAAPSKSASDLLTWRGITFYGNVDIGAGYMTHGQDLSPNFPTGRNYLVGRASGDPEFGFNPNADSFSVLGLRGAETVVPGVKVVFDLETGFVPTSGRLADGIGSFVPNNGKSVSQMSGNGDSSRDGQVFNSVAWGGLSTKYGTLTFGRQASLDTDFVTAYDPVAGAAAFSLIGIQQYSGGGGTAEGARFDNAFKYTGAYGPVRASFLYQLPDAPGKGAYDGHGGGTSVEADLGATIQNLSVDVTFSQINDALFVTTLSAAQYLTNPHNSLSATASDNTSVLVGANYKVGKLTLYAAYQNVRFTNPSDPVEEGADLYGYDLSVVNDDAYVRNKTLQYIWFGARYAVTPKLTLRTGYYYETQNDYAAQPCENASNSACAGSLSALSGVADYQWTKYFDVYFGAMYSRAANGLAFGFQNSTNFDPTAGIRVTF